MLLKEVMTTNVATIAPEATIQQAAKQMKDLDVGVLPLPSTNGDRGVVTDRDIVVRGLAEGKGLDTPVSEVMTETALCMDENTPIEDAKDAMELHQVRRLLVLNSADDLVGIVSLGDLAVHCDADTGGEVLQKVSYPTRPDRASAAS